MTIVTADEIVVQPYPHTRVGWEAHVPVVVELPAEVFAAVRTRYDRAESADQDFADYLCDVVYLKPTYTVDGLSGVIDEHTGKLTDETVEEVTDQ